MVKRPLIFILLILSMFVSGCSERDDIFIIDNVADLREQIGAFAFLTEQIGAFAFLTEQNQTTITTPDEYVQINGIFNNSIMQTFYYDFDVNAIIYNNTRSRYIVTHWTLTATASTSGTNLKVATKHNDVIRECGAMSSFIKFAGEYTTWSGFCVDIYEPSDSIQLVITADKSTTITIDRMVTYAKRFYNE